MARKKKNSKNVENNLKYAGIRFNPNTYVEIGADLDNFANSFVISEIDGVVTEYSLGGGGVIIEPLTVEENGTYEAESGKAYNPVTVNVEGYSETLLWENPNPGTGFNTDLLICEDIQDYAYVKIYYRKINSEDVYYSVIYPVLDLQGTDGIKGCGVLISYNEENVPFARPVFASYNEGAIELYASGLCSEIGASNEKKFRCIPVKVYGVTLG